MFNLLFIKWINSELIGELEATITRIPKDLKTWKKEIKRLRFKRDRKTKKLVKGYGHSYVYYLGKMLAYVYVLEKLGDSKFVAQWEKKFKVRYLKGRRETHISGKW